MHLQAACLEVSEVAFHVQSLCLCIRFIVLIYRKVGWDCVFSNGLYRARNLCFIISTSETLFDNSGE